MTIRKYTGKTKDEAIAAARAELGEQVVILNAKEVPAGGIFGVFKKSTYEVTAAIEEEAVALRGTSQTTSGRTSVVQESAPVKVKIPAAVQQPAPPRQPVATGTSTFSAVADEPIDLFGNGKKTDPEDLRSAFQEIGELIKNTENVPQSTYTRPEKKSNVIKSDQIESIDEAESHLISLATTRPSTPKKEEEPEDQVTDPSLKEHAKTLSGAGANMSFVKVLYNTLLDHEVEEIYINQLLEDMGKILSSGNSIDYLLSSVYQKMVLKLGQPHVITLSEERRPKVVFFIGPTGVGKTTTIAKLASKYKVERGKKVALLTADTYRIAAAEQLNVYAKILETPFTICYSPDDINTCVSENADADLILVDTVGFSHKNEKQKADLEKMINSLDDKYDKDIYLVLSATTKFKDLRDIVDTYRSFTDFRLLFTKLDETLAYGNILNMRMYSGAELSYVTDGQNVPDDIKVLDAQACVFGLLGGQ